MFRLDPSNIEAREFEQTVYASRDEFTRREEEARALQEEQRRKVEELQRKLAEQARLEEDLQQQRAVREAKIAGCLQKTREYIRDGIYDKALTEIETVYAMDPGNAEAREYEQSVLTIQRKAEEARTVSEQRSQQSDAWNREEEERQKSADEGREVLRAESVNTYRAMLRQAWAGRRGRRAVRPPRRLGARRRSARSIAFAGGCFTAERRSGVARRACEKGKRGLRREP